MLIYILLWTILLKTLFEKISEFLMIEKCAFIWYIRRKTLIMYIQKTFKGLYIA